ncbi:MAG: glycine dehydrogenase, partial [Halobacteriota archaeon]
DPVALSVLEAPGDYGADVVVGDASALGAGTAYGMGCGLFAVSEDHLRQTPGHLVGASEDADGRRAYTLTLQTREQHIRRERATSNICTNQSWMALRTAMHVAWLGPDGLLDLAERCVELPRRTAEEFDDVDGVSAPAFDRHHFREFEAEVDGASGVRDALLERGYAVGVADGRLRVCVTETVEHEVVGLVGALEEVVG